MVGQGRRVRSMVRRLVRVLRRVRPGSRKLRACEPGSQTVCLPADNF